MTDFPKRAGTRALAAWVLASLFFLYAFVQRVSPSVMVDELMRDFSVGAAALGNLSAFYFYTYASLQIPVGVLMDRVGPRRLLTAAAALCAVGSLVFASSSGLLLASLGRALIGAGAGFGFVGALTLATQWFPPWRFAQLGGLTQAAGMAGAIFGQAPLALAVGAFGWRSTLAAVGVVGAAFAVALWLLVRDRPHAATATIGIGEGMGRIAANPQTWINAVFGLSLTGPMLAFAGLWGVPWLVAIHGMTRQAAAGVLSLMFVGWGVGCPLLGLFSDRWGRRKPIMVSGAVLAAATLAAVFYVPRLSPAGMAGLMAAHGFFASVMILGFACAREHNDAGLSGNAYGFVNTAVVGSGALFQPLLGLLLDLNWDGTMAAGVPVYSEAAYRTAFSVLPVVCLLGGALALIGRETYARARVEAAAPLAA